MKDIGSYSIKELAGLIAHSLSQYGVEAVLTGGSCVTIYSSNKYVSGDLDFVTDTVYQKKITAAMDDIGFKQMPEKHFMRPGCKYFVEFIPAPLSIGKEPVEETKKIKTKRGTFKLLTPTDCVKDRLAAFFHWNDRQSLDQAIIVARKQKVNRKEIRRWAVNENNLNKYEEFLKLL